MANKDETREQLIGELAALRQRVAELEALETERKRAEEMLRFQKSLLECQSEAAIDGILVVSEDRQWLSFNRRFTEMWGIPEDVVKTRSSEVALQAVRDKLVDPEQFVAKILYLYEHQDEESHDEIALKDGRIFERYSAPVKGADGVYYGRVWYYYDITERVQTESQRDATLEALRRSEQEKAAILNSLSELVVYQDTEMRILWANRVAGESVGLTPDQLVGRYCYAIWNQRDEPCVGCPIVETQVTGQPQEAEMTSPDGRARLIRGDPVRSADGDVEGIVEVVQDITERKRAEEALLQTSRLEATATLAGGIAHDFNNLMVGVLGYAEILKMDLADRPDALDMLTTISETAQRAAKLAQQMLAFARGGKNQPRVMNLNDAIQGVLGARKRSLPAGIHTVFNAEPDLWDVEADPTQASEVVLNLLTNAVEAVEDSGRIAITTSNVVLDEGNVPDLAPGAYVCLSVQDTGCGMSKEIQSRIFEPFFTTKFQGRGMGLAAAYGIVENHGGHISVCSKEGRGTTFTVYFPAIQV